MFRVIIYYHILIDIVNMPTFALYIIGTQPFLNKRINECVCVLCPKWAKGPFTFDGFSILSASIWHASSTVIYG